MEDMKQRVVKEKRKDGVGGWLEGKGGIFTSQVILLTVMQGGRGSIYCDPEEAVYQTRQEQQHHMLFARFSTPLLFTKPPHVLREAPACHSYCLLHTYRRVYRKL